MENRGLEGARARVYRRGEDRDHSRVERPKRPPKERERKKFEELVEKDDEKKTGKEAKANAAISEREAKQDKSKSIFDLSADNAQEDSKSLEVADLTDSVSENNPLNLLAGSDSAKVASAQKLGEEADLADKQDEGGKWAAAQQMISGDNTQIAQGATIRGSNMQELIKQLTEQLAVLKQNGRTDTIMTLKHPPLFAGAELKITEFSSAKGEFNLTFHNLSPEAKALIDSQANQNALRHGLEGKGFALHIVTSTSEPAPIATAEADRGREEGDEQSGQQQREQEEREQERDSR